MKSGLCLKMAIGNIKKNYRFFIPRILAETGLLACFYIIFTLAMDGRLAEVKGGEYIPTFMWMGAVVIAILSVILMTVPCNIKERESSLRKMSSVFFKRFLKTKERSSVVTH